MADQGDSVPSRGWTPHNRRAMEVRERERFQILGTEVLPRKPRGQRRGHSPYFVDRPNIGICAEYLVALPQHPHQIPAGTAACIEDAHTGLDLAAQYLIEEVNINGAELLLKTRHGSPSIVGDIAPCNRSIAFP